ncbi:MAG: hypothetical protein U1E51_06685 [Candidatus Binatia bacterium]|nr:hypothetical protein [Candidatus Binatia bacterium]
MCRHKQVTSPRRDEAGLYTGCLSCGRRIPFAWADGPEFSRDGHRIGNHRTQEASPRKLLTEITRIERQQMGVKN